MRLRKSFYVRKSRNQKSWGSIFNQSSTGISILHVFLSAIVAPVVVTTSLLLTQSVLMLVNICLCLGYVSDFIYRVITRQASQSEIRVTAAGFVGLFVASFFIFPTLPSVSLIALLIFANHLAVLINTLFIVKDVVVAPVEKLLEATLAWMGFDVRSTYYDAPVLTSESSLHEINALIRASYPNEPRDLSHPEPEKVNQLNQLLVKLVEYLNKYSASPIIRKDDIARVKKQISEVANDASPVSSYTLMGKKLDYKLTKLSLLQQAKSHIQEEKKHVLAGLAHDDKSLSKYLRWEKQERHNPSQFFNQALGLVDKEMNRQMDKIHSLLKCLPPQKHPPAKELSTFSVCLQEYKAL